MSRRTAPDVAPVLVPPNPEHDPAVPGGGVVEYQARALTAAQLRAFYRVHLRWLFVGCGIGSTSLLIPREHWALHALWWLTVLVGGGIAFPRILLLNGIAEELRRRTPEHSGDATPTRPSPPSDQPAD